MPTVAGQSQAYGKLPLAFELNRGQAAGDVKFLAQGAGYSLQLGEAGALIELRDVSVRMRVRGAAADPEVSGLEVLPGTANYFIGNDPSAWRTGIPTYARVLYREVYPGIDLVFHGEQGQLEYDFLVAPGADPGAIALGFEGADSLAVDARGDLVVGVRDRSLRFQKPRLYQERAGGRKVVNGGYLPRGGSELGFAVGRFDRSRPLVIDPVLTYSTYLGGSCNDEGHGIAVDGVGNAYVAGATCSPDFPTASPLETSPGAGNHAFITKLNAAGNALVYSTYLGGNGGEAAFGIAVDGSGNAYVAGYTSSTNFPTANPIQAANGGAGDAFVTKLNAAGSALIYSTYLGGSADDSGRGIAVDPTGNAYVTGFTISPNFPTVNPFQPTKTGYLDAFVTELNTAGSALLYSTFLAGRIGASGSGIAADTAGNAYVTGTTGSTDFPTVNPIQAANRGVNAFVAKLNAAGSALVYSTYLGGSGRPTQPGGTSDDGRGIAVDGAGNAYVTGSTESTDFPTTSNAFQPASGGGAGNAFVSKLNAAGTALVYSTYVGGSGYDSGNGIALDGSGNAYITGSTTSGNFPIASPIQSANAGIGNAFVTELNAAGSALIYSTYLGGSGYDRGYGVAVGGNGAAYMTGLTGSDNFPTVNPIYAANGGLTDAFVAKLSPSGGTLPPVVAVLPAVANAAYGGYVTAATIQNTGSAPAIVQIAYFNQNGAPVGTGDTIGSLAVNASWTVRQDNGNSFPSSGGNAAQAGSAIVYSSQPIASFVNEFAPGNVGDATSYSGVQVPSGVGATLYAPTIVNNAYGAYTTGIGLLNQGSSPTDVTITYRGGNGIVVKTQTVTALAAHAYQALYSGDAGLALPSGFVGTATITSSSGQPLGAIVNETGPGGQFSSYDAVPSASTLLNVPVALNNAYGGYYTGMGIQNTSASGGTVSVTYYDASGTATVKSFPIAANGSLGVYQGSATDGPAAGAYTAVIQSSTVPLAAIVNEVAPAGGTARQSTSYNTFSAGSSSLHLPLVENAGSDPWNTGEGIMGTGPGSTTVTVSYYDAVTGAAIGTPQAQTLAAHAFWGLYQPTGGLPSGKRATAVITTSSGGQVAVICNESSSTTFMSYDGQ